MINLASDKKLLIIEYILENKEFTQYKIKQDIGLGGSTVNQTINFLLEKEVVQQKDKKYVLLDAESLLELVAFFKNMKDYKIEDIQISLDKKELYKYIPKDAIYCMDSALEQYTNYYKTNKVCIYISEEQAKKIKDKLKLNMGNKTILNIYKLGLINSIKIKGLNYTSKIKTIIDMYCDKRGNSVETLLKKL
jgi:hypothetical protein